MNIRKKSIAALGFLCFIIGAAGLVYTFYTEQGRAGAAESIEMERELDAAEIRALSVTTNVSHISLIPEQTDQIRVQLTGTVPDKVKKQLSLTAETSGDRLVVDLDIGKQLNIGLSLSQWISWFDQDKLELKVYVPQRVYDSVKIKSDIGSVNVDQLQSDRFELESDTGKIIVSRFDGGQLTAKSAVGRVELSDIRSDRLKVQSNTGKVEVDGFAGNSLEIESDLGAVQLYNINSPIKVKTDTGKIELNADTIAHDTDLAADIGAIEVNLNEEPTALQFDLYSNIGKVSFKPGRADYEVNESGRLKGSIGSGGPVLRIKTDVGKITVH